MTITFRGNKCIKSNGARFLCRKFEERRRLNFLRNVSNLINCKYDSWKYKIAATSPLGFSPLFFSSFFFPTPIDPLGRTQPWFQSVIGKKGGWASLSMPESIHLLECLASRSRFAITCTRFDSSLLPFDLYLRRDPLLRPTGWPSIVAQHVNAFYQPITVYYVSTLKQRWFASTVHLSSWREI